ncbi:MAG: TonB-dependent receptor, partial [Nevskiales bacterium]|nr:TonB-dependent receptor [Nevskiales bacterium]
MLLPNSIRKLLFMLSGLAFAGFATAAETPASAADPVLLEPVKVVGEHEENRVTTATKTDTPLMETPVSVQTVPEQVLQDQRSNTLQDVLENVSGVRSSNNDVEGYVFNIRGFQSLNVFRNGLLESFAIATLKETANLDRVEVLKGPASILFGRMDPGGVINRVTKKPQAESGYRLEQEFGSYGHDRTQWDATGALNDDKSLAYRVTGAYQDNESFRDFQGGKRAFIAPALRWTPGPTTVFTLEAEYLDNDAQSDIGQIPQNGRPAELPPQRSFQEPNDPDDTTEGHLLSHEFTHRFNTGWVLINRFHYAAADLYKLNVVPTALTGNTLDRAVQYQALDGDTYGTNVDFTQDFAGLGGRHRVLLGLDYFHDYYNYVYAENATSSIDIFNPVYGTVPDSDMSPAFALIPGGFFSAADTRQTGVYVQDQATYLEKWHVLLGVRYDYSSLGSGGGASAAEAEADLDAQTRQSDRAFS